MSAKVSQIIRLLDGIAPFALAEEWDNVGLLAGNPDSEVDTVLCALDLNRDVLDEAVRRGAQLIVTHHPLMFDPLRTLTDDNYEARLIRRLAREDISLIAAHTCLDRAPGGVNDTLAELCGLTEVTGEGFFRCGLLPAPLSVWEYAEQLKAALRTEVRLMGPGDAVIRKVGLCSGSGGSEWPAAAETGCDAFVSGEIKHHFGLAMAGSGIVGLECGHFATEEPGIRALASALQKELNTIECNVRIYVSKVSAYSFPRQP